MVKTVEKDIFLPAIDELIAHANIPVFLIITDGI